MRRNRNFIGPQGMGGMVSLWGASSLIKSVQRGTIAVTAATSAISTINAVDMNNSVLKMLLTRGTTAGQFGNKWWTRIELTNATTVTAYVQTAPTPDSATCSFEIIEYMPGVIKSIQRGTMNVTTPATITAVDMNKSALDHLGVTDSVGISSNDVCTRVILTNSTTVTPATSNPNAQVTGYQVVEMF